MHRVKAFLAQTLSAGECVLAAVSGGADSMAMLDVLDACREEVGYTLEVVHIHHHLRAESDAEWRFVEEACKARALPFHGVHIDVKAYAKKEGLSMEAAAHTLRYEALYRVLDEVSGDYLALAHHANDRAETLLMNMLRGSGIQGLCAMPQKKDPVIRPLLALARSDIEAYCADKDLAYVTDASNFDTTIARNRIRHELLTVLESYNPAVVEALGRLALSAEEDNAYIREEAQKLRAESLFIEAASWVLFDRAKLLNRHHTLIKKLVRACVQDVARGRSPLRFEQAEQACSMIEAGKGHLDIGQGLVIEATRRYVFIGRTPQGAWTKKANAWHHQDLDGHFEAAGDNLAVRTYQAGDTLRQKNLGRKSLKKIFQERALPPLLRSVWPVVIDTKTKDVLWLPFLAQTEHLGYHYSISHSEAKAVFKIGKSTASIKS